MQAGRFAARDRPDLFADIREVQPLKIRGTAAGAQNATPARGIHAPTFTPVFEPVQRTKPPADSPNGENLRRSCGSRLGESPR